MKGAAAERVEAHATSMRCVLRGAEFRSCPFCSSGQLAINPPRNVLLHRDPPCEPFANVVHQADSFEQALLIVQSPAVFA